MKVILSLKRTTGTFPTIQPYWFTNDGSIHLTRHDDNQEIDLSTLSLLNLTIIKLGVMKNKIVISDEAALLDAMKNFEAGNNDVIVKEATRHIKSQDDLKKEKVEVEVKEKKAVASDLISKAAKVVIEAVGQNKLTERGELKAGISDIRELDLMFSVESAKDKPRKTVLEAIKLRVEAINESTGFMVDEEEVSIKEKGINEKLVNQEESEDDKE